MKMRAPAYPLITVDPYFSVWSTSNKLYESDIKTWDSRTCFLIGKAEIDGNGYIFMGSAKDMDLPPMTQTDVTVNSFSTTYIFEAAGVRLTADFFTPVLPIDLDMLSRPASYLKITADALDDTRHTVNVTVYASQDFCVERKLQNCVLTERLELSNGISAMKMGGVEQAVLGSSGDDRGIDWGYFFLACNNGTVQNKEMADRVFLQSVSPLDTADNNTATVVFAYDDIYSVKYFGEPLRAYWKRDGKTTEKIIEEAFSKYDNFKSRCDEFDINLCKSAADAGGEKYAQLLRLSVRQIMAACKLVVKNNGEILYITKECLSNGCAATVDVAYPTLPFFLLYNPVLAEAIVRPAYEYVKSGKWSYKFAPHDLGTYPILNGQVYGNGFKMSMQMPVEECGNMLIMTAAVTKAIGNTELFDKYSEIAGQWAEYLSEFGADPDNQLCTDDFAGHLAHNCNLALKSVFALASYAKLCSMTGDDIKAEYYEDLARKNAGKWRQKAANGDGTYKLTFDRPGTFSMKYNAVWDKVFDLGIFPENMWEDEIKGYEKHFNPYGLPLDSRSDCTKSDWMIWAATLSGDDEFFKKTVDALWLNYNLSPSRVPLNDLFSSVTSLQIHFQHRSVQGGMFIKLLDSEKICSLKK